MRLFASKASRDAFLRSLEDSGTPTQFEMLNTRSGDGYAITSVDLDIAKDPSSEL